MGKPAPLRTVAEALSALERDKLALVTYSARWVHVTTAHGAGSFSLADWQAGGGQRPSVSG